MMKEYSLTKMKKDGNQKKRWMNNKRCSSNSSKRKQLKKKISSWIMNKSLVN